MREQASLSEFSRLMNGGTAGGMQGLPKRSSAPFLQPPGKGMMTRTPTDVEVNNLKKYPGQRFVFDQMYGPGAAAAAMGGQYDQSQPTQK